MRCRRTKSASCSGYGRADFLYRSHPIALRLLLLTLCRKGELIAAKWEHVDLDKGEWYVPPVNQKSAIPHLVPFSSQALALFTSFENSLGFPLRSTEFRRPKGQAYGGLIPELGAMAVDTEA